VHPTLIFVQRDRRDPIVEFVGVGHTAFECSLETVKGLLRLAGGQTEPYRLAPAAGHVQDVVRRRLGPDLGGVNGLATARDDVLVERILDVGSRVGLAPETRRVTFILGEEQLRGPIAMQVVFA
jgi:hypothetical protein